MIGKVQKMGFYPLTVLKGVALGDGTSRTMKDIYQENIANYDSVVKAINHRGYSTAAPENTLPAVIMSKMMGFNYVEIDVAFTSDSVPVLLHDATIDRTSNGSGTLSEMTYEEVSQYDFGSWFSDEYTGTTIPTFTEFIRLCRAIGVHPYIELKSSATYTREQIQSLVDIVKQHGMRQNVTWISFNIDYLYMINSYDNTQRIGYLSGITETAITRVQELGNGFLDTNYANITDELVQTVIDANIPLEVYTVNSASIIRSLNPYITGVTSDSLIAGKELLKEYIK